MKFIGESFLHFNVDSAGSLRVPGTNEFVKLAEFSLILTVTVEQSWSSFIVAYIKLLCEFRFNIAAQLLQ